MKKNIYCISGLGADERLFQNLHIPEADLIHLKWIAHEANDDVVSYAHKLARQINETNPILMGVSFGGMLAIEIAKLTGASKVFLVSSIKTAGDLPQIYHVAKSLHLVSLIPSFLIKRPSFLTDYIFGATDKKDKDLLHDYLRNSDVRYIKWALNAILHWENRMRENIIHVHGANDKVIPLPPGVDYKISGGHFVVFNRAKEISKIISKEMQKIEG
jgi:pimeloyl-ACP methyl ester carboxylesterase